MHDADWPALPYSEWRDTAATLQLWTQVVGKIRLALTPWLNHGWQVTLYVTARGLGTGPMPIGREILELEFDFIDHRLRARTSRGEEQGFPLTPQTVAEFYAQVLDLLARLGVSVKINEMPSEVADPIRFSEDRVHASYDPAAAHRFWRVLLRVNHVFAAFPQRVSRQGQPHPFVLGKLRPCGDAVFRKSGALSIPVACPGLPDDVTREAYSHEVSSAGFWPGSDAYPHPAFYSYAYPEPAGFRDRPVTAGAHFDTTLGEYILAYDTVRSAADPDALLLDFLATTYAAAGRFWRLGSRFAGMCARRPGASPRSRLRPAFGAPQEPKHARPGSHRRAYGARHARNGESRCANPSFWLLASHSWRHRPSLKAPRGTVTTAITAAGPKGAATAAAISASGAVA